MRPFPFFVTTTVSATIQILFGIVISIFSFASSYLMLPSIVNDPDVFSEISTPNIIPIILTLTPAISCLSTLLAPIAHGCTGTLYAYLHSRQAPVDYEEGALGGAACAALARFIVGIVMALISLAIIPFIVRGMSPQLQFLSPLQTTPLVSILVAQNVLGETVSICLGSFIAAAIGALGGLVGAGLFQSKS